jgi:UDP-galactopyranose mutase
MNFAVVGAGFSGAIIANELQKHGHSIHVFESRDHIGGNCFTKIDDFTNITLHKYGPHIFHTDDASIWNYVNSFTKFMPFINRVKTIHKDSVYSMPINLHTINQFFCKNFNPSEAQDFIKNLCDNSINEPKNFEEQAIKFIGKELYEAFFKSYTKKQWGIEPVNLPASILKRLPVRFNYDDNYFNHNFQGIPLEGYTPIFDKLLDQKSIKVKLKTNFEKENVYDYDHVFFTGPIDSYFNYKYGRLGYRTLDFELEYCNNDYQGCAVMNYPDSSYPFTRITEHKYFTPWLKFEKSIIYKEFSRNCNIDDIPYYPIRLADEKEMLKIYVTAALNESNVSFLGRLGTYRYLDMDITIREALIASKKVLESISRKSKIPVFFDSPL